MRGDTFLAAAARNAGVTGGSTLGAWSVKLTRALFFFFPEPSTDGVSEVSLIALLAGDAPKFIGEVPRREDPGECFIADFAGDTPRSGGSCLVNSTIGDAENRANLEGLCELPLTRPVLSDPEWGTSRLSDRLRVRIGDAVVREAGRIVVLENPLNPFAFFVLALVAVTVSASCSPSGSSRTIDGCFDNIPAARGDTGLLLVSDRAGFRGGGCTCVLTAVTAGFALLAGLSPAFTTTLGC